MGVFEFVFVCAGVFRICLSRKKRKCLFEQTHSPNGILLFVCQICIKESITETWNFNWNDDNLSKQKKYTKSNISMHI